MLTVRLLALVEPPVGFLGDLAPILPVLDLGLSGILIGVIIWFVRRRETLVSSGEWVSKRELDYLIAQYDARLERERQIAAEYRAAHETSERARELQGINLREVVSALGSLERFFDSFRAILERIDRDREFREREEEDSGA